MQPLELRTAEFESENELVEYIVQNIEMFCEDVLRDKLVSFECEHGVKTRQSRGLLPRERWCDLYIVCKSQVYVIEVKNPRFLSENRKGIGQLLDYGREFLHAKKGAMILLTTLFDIHTARTIKYYNLPIRYIYFEKGRMLEYGRDE